MRTITKPSEATPRELYHYEGTSVGLGGRPTLYFTAAECAQIARAYAASCEDSMTGYKDGKSGYVHWRDLFSQWEGK